MPCLIFQLFSALLVWWTRTSITPLCVMKNLRENSPVRHACWLLGRSPSRQRYPSKVPWPVSPQMNDTRSHAVYSFLLSSDSLHLINIFPTNQNSSVICTSFFMLFHPECPCPCTSKLIFVPTNFHVSVPQNCVHIVFPTVPESVCDLFCELCYDLLCELSSWPTLWTIFMTYLVSLLMPISLLCDKLCTKTGVWPVHACNSDGKKSWLLQGYR